MRNVLCKNCFIFSMIFSLLFISVLFPSCKWENNDVAPVTINLGSGGSARAISAEEKSSAVFNVYFNGERVGENVSGNFSAFSTVGQNLTVRVEAFVDGKRIASGESTLTVVAEQNIVNIVLREDREDAPSSPGSGGGGDSPSQPGDVPPSQPGGGDDSSPPGELPPPVDNVREVRTDDELTTALADATATIKLIANINLASTLTIGKNVTLDLNGNSITAPSGSRAFEVDDGNTLTIRADASQRGFVIGSGTVNGNGGIIRMGYSQTAGTGGATQTLGGIVILENVTLRSGNVTDNAGRQENGKGGAVYMYGGSLTMNNSDITSCSAVVAGGAVCVEGGGTFNMDNSVIGDADSGANMCEGRGGGVAVENGTFIMTGNCSIVGNAAEYGAGVSLNDTNANFTMNSDTTGSSPTISGNEANAATNNIYAGGVHVASGTFTMNAGSITGNDGGKIGDTTTGSDVYIAIRATFNQYNVATITNLKNENPD